MIYVTSSKLTLGVDLLPVKSVLRDVGKGIAKDARQLITGTGAGKRVKVHGQPHVASLPGQPPASLTGLLARSMKVSVKGTTLRVTDTAAYALALEGGAQGGGFKAGGGSSKSIRTGTGKNRKRQPTTTRIVAARPFLSTALTRAEPEIERKLDAAFDSIITQKPKP